MRRYVMMRVWRKERRSLCLHVSTSALRILAREMGCVARGGEMRWNVGGRERHGIRREREREDVSDE